VITAFVLIDARPDRIAELAEELADVDGVYEVYSVAGDVDIVAVARVRDHDQLADVVTHGIARCDGILSTRTLLAFRAYGSRDIAAAFGFDVE
jgi:DNA-binding Lrp family transcriptional regulator